jgi:hypothetical protein
MKLISLLQPFVLLLSLSTAAAWDKDGNLRQDTRPALIGQQLLDGNTAIQGGKESSYGFLEAFTNRLLPWWTNHVAKLDNNNSNTVHLDKEHDIILQVSSSTSARQGQPDIASKIHSSFMSLDQGHDDSSYPTTLLHSSDPGDHIKERMVLGDKQKQLQRQTKAYDDTADQGGKESSYGFLEAFTNRLLPWWTNHVANLPTTNGLTLSQAISHVRSVSSTHLAPTQEQEGRRQLEACQFADGTSGTKCVGADACAGIDKSKVGCGSCNGDSACSPYTYTDKITVGENSCNEFHACIDHINEILQSGGSGSIGRNSW